MLRYIYKTIYCYLFYMTGEDIRHCTTYTTWNLINKYKYVFIYNLLNKWINKKKIK